MKLLLMRNGLSLSAEESGVEFDAKRILSQKGIHYIHKVSQFITHNDIVPNKILCGPFGRSTETAELIAVQLGGIDLQPSITLAPGMGVDNLLTAIKNNCKNFRETWTLAIIHNPDMEYILARLTLKQDKYPFPIAHSDLYVLNITIEENQAKGEIIASYSPIRAEEISR